MMRKMSFGPSLNVMDEYTIIFHDNIYFISHIINLLHAIHVLSNLNMEEERAGAILLVYACLQINKKKRRKRSTWVKPYLTQRFQKNYVIFQFISVDLHVNFAVIGHVSGFRLRFRFSNFPTCFSSSSSYVRTSTTTTRKNVHGQDGELKHIYHVCCSSRTCDVGLIHVIG